MGKNDLFALIKAQSIIIDKLENENKQLKPKLKGFTNAIAKILKKRAR